jgi:alpha-galactosidase
MRKMDREMRAKTPPMGWMSWNLCGRDVNETIIRGIADAMVDRGLAAVGYEYVCIDDHWQGGRDASGNLYPCATKFPSGIKALADYVHERGLKLGIYSDAAELTCGGEVASLGFEEQDARTFAEWEVDYLKVDYCHAPEDRATAEERYTTMGRALENCGREIVFAACEWGGRRPWEWAKQAGAQVWRTTFDIRDVWETPTYDTARNGIMNAVERNAELAAYAGPGGWNDPDMLVVGLYGGGQEWMCPDGMPHCNETEYRSQMSLWCLMAAPLLATNDLRTMTDATCEILANPEAIAINQDALGAQAVRTHRLISSVDVWQKPLANGDRAIGILNRSEEVRTVQILRALPEGHRPGFQLRNLTFPASMLGGTPQHHVRDLWQHADLGAIVNEIALELAPHETKLLTLSLP